MFVLVAITNTGYGTIFYALSLLLGEDAAAGEFSRALLSGALGLGVVVSGALAPVVAQKGTGRPWQISPRPCSYLGKPRTSRSTTVVDRGSQGDRGTCL